MKQLVLQLPSLSRSEPGDWLKSWEQEFGDIVVEQLDWDHPLRGDWQIALQEKMWALQDVEHTCAKKFFLIAHGLGCHLVSAWSAHSPHVDWIAGAMLVDPYDLFGKVDNIKYLSTWIPPMMHKLPFKTCVVTREINQHSSVEGSKSMARCWGSQYVQLSQAEGLKPMSLHGAWRELRVIFEQFQTTI